MDIDEIGRVSRWHTSCGNSMVIGTGCALSKVRQTFRRKVTAEPAFISHIVPLGLKKRRE
ncbi:MAG: hypothetical protein ACMUIA_10175 [bacterium]